MVKRIEKFIIEFIVFIFVLFVFVITTGKYLTHKNIQKDIDNITRSNFFPQKTKKITTASHFSKNSKNSKKTPTQKIVLPSISKSNQMNLLYLSDVNDLNSIKISNTSGNEKNIPVLLYHGIVEDKSKLSPEDTTLSEFKDQMYTLKSLGYQTISLNQFYSFMKGTITLPQKSLLLTFDDGKKNSYYESDPILKALDYNAVMYVITQHYKINKPSSYYLTKSELMSMQTSGRWELQSHGYLDHNPIIIDSIGNKGHFMSNKMWLNEKNRIESDNEFRNRIKSDMVQSKNDLLNDFGIEDISYAYPFGSYGNGDLSQITREEVNKVYPISFIQFKADGNAGYNRANYAQNNQQIFKRIKVTHQFSTNELVNTLKASEAKSLPFIENFNNGNSNWVSNDINNKINIINGKLDFKSVDNSTSSNIYLDGGNNLNNYEFTLHIKLLHGQEYNLIGYFENKESYYTCSFSNNFIKIREILGNNNILLKESSKQFKYNPQIERNVGILINNHKISCLLDGKPIITANLSNAQEKLNSGTIGINIYDKQINVAEAEISNVELKNAIN